MCCSNPERQEYVRLQSALWLAAFDLGRGVSRGKSPKELEDKIIEAFFSRTHSRKRKVCIDLLEAMPAELRLLDLNVDDHGERIMRLASDMLRG